MAFRALRQAPAAARAVLSRPNAAAAAAPPARSAASASFLLQLPSSSVRAFHATPRARVQVGDAVPDLVVLHEDSPANKVSLAREFGTGVGDGLVIGVPAAFSPACSATHIPGYIAHPKLADAGQVFVVSVNDAFVMSAWANQLDPTKESGIRFLADPTGEFTKALELGFDDAAPVFGGMRAKRYALVIKDGKVESIHVEPDNTGTNASLAENVLA
ncbi:Redoxin [Xylariaceae sp. FL0804]|nr:Redoxin [Xylariaceae sp. FL0804]